MKFELQHLQILSGGDAPDRVYTADLYIDGVHIARINGDAGFGLPRMIPVSNDGPHPTIVTTDDERRRAADSARTLAAAHAFARTMRPVEIEIVLGRKLRAPMTLALWIQFETDRQKPIDWMLGPIAQGEF